MPRIQSYDKKVIADAITVHFKCLPEALEELGVEISNVTKADGEIMFSFEPKDLTSICSVFKIKKKIKSKMTEEQKQIARDRLKEAREHKDLTP